jgi:phenylpropionate dioxygenase-like ring-hydroxylating dioxygenase large terminal subunit
MANEQLIEMAKKLVHHGVNETMELVDGQKAVPATTYTDEALFQQERRQIFHRLPLMLAPSCELPNPGDYKAMEVAGIPVLVTRQSDGSAQAFLNSCTHRGNPIADGSGNAKRFTCNYHGWTFRNDGALMGIANANDFGTVDKASLCLKSFPTEERAGMIFVILNPKSELTVGDMRL